MGSQISNPGNVQIELSKTKYYIGEPIQGKCSFIRQDKYKKVYWGIQGIQELYWIGKNNKKIEQSQTFYQKSGIIDESGEGKVDGKEFTIYLDQNSQILTPSLAYQGSNSQINIYYEIFGYFGEGQNQDQRQDLKELKKHQIIFHIPFPNIQNGIQKSFNLPIYKHIFQMPANLQIQYQMNSINYKVGQDMNFMLEINNKNTSVDIIDIELDFILELRLKDISDSQCCQQILYKHNLGRILHGDGGEGKKFQKSIPIKNENSQLQCSARTQDFFYQYFIRVKLVFDRYWSGSSNYEERIKINVYNS